MFVVGFACRARCVVYQLRKDVSRDEDNLLLGTSASAIVYYIYYCDYSCLRMSFSGD